MRKRKASVFPMGIAKAPKTMKHAAENCTLDEINTLIEEVTTSLNNDMTPSKNKTTQRNIEQLWKVAPPRSKARRNSPTDPKCSSGLK